MAKESPNNYLDFVPYRTIGHEVDSDSHIVLLRPKFMKGIFAKILQPYIKSKYFRVRLDKFGSKTWETIDGKRSIRQIADLLYGEFKEAIEPRYERCSKFIHSLSKGSMVKFEQDKE